MADAIDPNQLLSDILIHKALAPRDDTISRIADAGVTDAEDTFEYLLDEIRTEASELVDGRCVWLRDAARQTDVQPPVHHPEPKHDVLTSTRIWTPVTALREGERYASVPVFVDRPPRRRL